MQIPSKYKRSGVLGGILEDAIDSNWARIKANWDEVYSHYEDRQTSPDINRRLLKRFRLDIRQDGAGFIDTPDGVGSRISNWLEEMFPEVFR